MPPHSAVGEQKEVNSSLTLKWQEICYEKRERELRTRREQAENEPEKEPNERSPYWAPSATSICKLRLWASLPEQATMGQQVASEMRRPRQQQLPQSEMETQTELQHSKDATFWRAKLALKSIWLQLRWRRRRRRRAAWSIAPGQLVFVPPASLTPCRLFPPPLRTLVAN